MTFRLRSALLIAWYALSAAAVAAQVRVGVGILGTWSTPLVRDSIVEPITVRSVWAPTLLVTLGGRLDSLYGIGLHVAVTRGAIQRVTPEDTTELLTATVWEPAVRVHRPVGRLEVGLTAGLRVYQPGRAIGIFRDGGTTGLALGATVGFRAPRIAGLDPLIHATWSVARFSTTTLRLAGFSGAQAVNRVGVGVLLVRGGL